MCVPGLYPLFRKVFFGLGFLNERKMNHILSLEKRVLDCRRLRRGYSLATGVTGGDRGRVSGIYTLGVALSVCGPRLCGAGVRVGSRRRIQSRIFKKRSHRLAWWQHVSSLRFSSRGGTGRRRGAHAASVAQGETLPAVGRAAGGARRGGVGARLPVVRTALRGGGNSDARVRAVRERGAQH